MSFTNKDNLSLEETTKLVKLNLIKCIENFLFFAKNLTEFEQENYLQTAKYVYELCGLILNAEKFLDKNEINSLVLPIKNAARTSPLFTIVQDWPLGYVGDFQTIEYVFKGENKAKKNTIGYYLESLIINSAIAQQHRNKVQHQANVVLNKAKQNPSAKILSIGCGSSIDLDLIQYELSQTNVEITLVDQDNEALNFSQTKLNKLSNIRLIQGNILRIIFQMKDSFDLIVIGGVFDYLKDKYIISLVSKIYENNLNTSGELFFTNIATHNPYRTWMEYLFNWTLIERTDEEISLLCQNAKIDRNNVNIFKEETHLTYLAHIFKK
jgi:extracellular factor (EF) 3-hydroxypalmitic acid methyl ester biosynthesis protein